MTILTNANASYTTKPSGDSEGMWGGMITGAARWMPDTLASLVVGRNSRFFTEELDDEELEQIGGVEYRALRLLSYAVAAVSLSSLSDRRSKGKRDVESRCEVERSTMIERDERRDGGPRKTDEAVYIPVPSYPICDPRHILRKSIIMGFSLSIEFGRPSWNSQQNLVLPLLGSVCLYRDWSYVSP